MTKIDWLHHEETTKAEAISALQAQDSPKPIAESVQNVSIDDSVTQKEVKELSKNSPKLDKENGDLPTCNQLATDTISRQDEIFALCSECQCRRIPCANYPCGEVKTLLRRLPSAQHEIIHCKDCKHFGVDRYKKLTWCSRINYGYGYQADDFCSKAERRTDD